MLVMKMRSSSPANRPVKRICVHVQKKKKCGYLQLAVSSDWRKPAVNCYCPKKVRKKKLYLSVDLLNDYMCFFTLQEMCCGFLLSREMWYRKSVLPGTGAG